MRGRTLLVQASCLGFILSLGAFQHDWLKASIVSSATAAPIGAVAMPTLAPMLAAVSPAVVNISIQGTLKAPRTSSLRGSVYPPNMSFRAVGSGVIIDSAQGYVITNYHLIEPADKIQVVLRDNRRMEAIVVGGDPQTDIAVLKIDADRLTAMPLGVSRSLRVGDYVVAIGNPFGLGQSATFGIVSGLGRTDLGLESYEDFIQTDASINPGNSGGALIDLNGRLVGISTAILSGSGGNVGVGFVIPIDMANSVARQLIAFGNVTRGALGVTVQDVVPALARGIESNAMAGAVVSQVQPRSAAAKAGVRQGDVIVALDGEPVTSGSQLRSAIAQKQPGTAVHLSLLRNRQEQSVSITLDPLRAVASAGTSRIQ